MSSKEEVQTAPAWHAAYPAPSNPDPPGLSRSQLLQGIRQGRKDFVLVDLRRTDHEGGSIRGSINLPAQSLYPSIRTLYDLVSAAGVEHVVFYCGSSRGRGPRAAGWFEDHIRLRGDGSMKSWVLLEGIKGWAGAGSDFTRLMDEYDEKVWQQTKKD
ncbi:MAG: hypothetical protein M1816_003081 [Peltula sp. TS41687]|nr:MAG: hypothetical protein M1816_003081 [Peltula sp. TS41687]